MGWFKKSIYLLVNLLAVATGLGLLARFVPPDAFWPPATIALVLSPLLFLTMIAAAYGLFRRRWRAVLLPTLVTLAAVPLLPRLFAFGGGTPATADTPTVRLVTNNVRSFQNDAHRPVDSAGALAFLPRQQPDILLLQETRHDGYGAENAYYTAIKRASGLGKRHQLPRRSVATYADEIEFVAEEFKRSNGFQVTDVTTAIGVLRVINAHLESNRISAMVEDIGNADVGVEIGRAENMLRAYGGAAARRAEQATAIRRYVRESPHPVIVAGDFNDVPSSYTYHRVLTPRLRDAWAEAGFGLGTTFTGPLPGLRIDYVLVDTALTVHAVERFDGGYSDHLGLAVTLGRR